MITLTREEREKFAAYLEQDARGDIALAEQMEKITTPRSIIERYRRVAQAKLLVTAILRRTETEEVR